MNGVLITTEQTETLHKLFDDWEGVSIRTGKDYQKLGEMFDEDE